MNMTLSISEVDFEEIVDELSSITKEHWNEVGHSGVDAPFELDIDVYKSYSKLNAYKLFAVKDDDKIVGYLGCFIHNLTHNASAVAATTDALFLLPAYRKGSLAVKLIKYTEKYLADLGVDYIQLGTNTNYDLSSLCNRLGYVPSSIVYTKKIKE